VQQSPVYSITSSASAGCVGQIAATGQVQRLVSQEHGARMDRTSRLSALNIKRKILYAAQLSDLIVWNPGLRSGDDLSVRL